MIARVLEGGLDTLHVGPGLLDVVQGDAAYRDAQEPLDVLRGDLALDLVGERGEARITSYNVCYTKLLR